MPNANQGSRDEKVQVGDKISEWEGLDPLIPYLHLVPPPVDTSNQNPNLTKYPNVAGTGRLAVTGRPITIRKRSWMGWFLWSDGTPPASANDPWDFYSWQYAAGTRIESGKWTPIRLDQQPLYLNPFRINYNWPPGKFGYEAQPLKDFAPNVGYWAEKRIVRGVNLSFANPYLTQYDDKRDTNPETWRRSWLYVNTRPLETFVIVPSNKTPNDLLQKAPFPYPLWDENLSIQDQTPFHIKVDRMGDWDADLVWEGTHPRATKSYPNNRYQKTAFKDAGIGNYLKMTVAQGSPYTWCETNNNRYAIFYNLIRTNEKGNINNTGGTKPTNAKVIGGPRDVPGVQEVQYVLLYGNQTNPNQFYHEVEPFHWDNDSGKPGGWNPPGKQSNHTYVAIYFRKDAVVQPSAANSGTDGQGNPYFYLEFNNVKNNAPNKKNWFVIGAVPVMHYYHSSIPEDDEKTRISAAQKWAEELGKYAFNFLTETKISFLVKNMYQVTTKYTTVLQNPYVAAGGDAAKTMTADSQNTVIALLPHHYQPIALGPDFTQTDAKGNALRSVIWKPLRTSVIDFPVNSSILRNANKTDPTSPGSYWGYWSPRGNQKAIVASEFETVNLFQNFLPVTPPPQWDKEYDQSGIQAVRITDVGRGYTRLPTEPVAADKIVLPKAVIKDSTNHGSGAVLTVLLEPFTDRIQQIDVDEGGKRYPNGNPPDGVTVQIDPPGISESKGGRQAKAWAQTSGGRVVAVFMIDRGAGYRSSIQVVPASGEPDPPIIPLFRDGGPEDLQKGIVKVVVGGAGWSGTAPTVNILGTGSGAKAEIVKPGQIIQVVDSGIGGFTDHGTYPWTGSSDDVSKRIVVYVPPPPSGGEAQTAKVASVQLASVKPKENYFKTLIADPGAGYTSQPTTAVPVDGSKAIQLQNVLLNNGQVFGADPDIASLPTPFDKPIKVTFKPASGTVTREAKATFYPGCSVESIILDGAPISGYADDLEIAFSGGDAGSENFAMPEFGITVANGAVTNVVLKKGGYGFYQNGEFQLQGGKGFDAALSPILTESNLGELIAVKVLRPGSNYPETGKVCAYAEGGGKKCELDVEIYQGCVAKVTLKQGVDYKGFKTIPSIFLMAAPFDKDQDYNSRPAKGKKAVINFTVQKVGVLGPIATAQIVKGNEGERYLVDKLYTATPTSLPAIPRFADLYQLATANQAARFLAKVAKPKVKVEQVLYDSLISQFSSMGSADLKPFGGAFGSKTAPDGYGLGKALSSVTKVLGVLYNLQQHYAKNKQDVPLVIPSLFVINQATGGQYEWPIYRRNHPLVTLGGGLKTMTQALQRTLSLFFQDPPYTNHPAPADWIMAYFSLYDKVGRDKAGRVVVNPTATIPVLGVVSSIMDPPDIPDSENKDKQGLKKWKKGMLWSGFGVSDQWNDQHYFYGYYLSAAGILAVLDGSWDPLNRPKKLWSDADRIGTAVDQWMKTLAYDPILEGVYYDYNNCAKSGVTYEKYPFFDQWNGHSWATGVSPGRAGDVENSVPWSKWSSYGTGNASYDDENENSTWEGLQAFSAMILWGAGTNRKPIVNQGIYLLTTGNAASDLYFLDKNYNQKKGPENSYSWCPVTTGTPASGKDGGNAFDINTGYVDANPEAFYGEASAGCSIVKKGSCSLNNFFWAYPTGSKFIEAYPPTPWTMGMSRNIAYMQKWAGAMNRPEWKKARESALFQPGNWLGMAMSAALCGVPFNPGDDPKKVFPYVQRLWSSWIVDGSAPGDQATMQPAEKPTSVLNFLHTLEVYGAPDWSIYAKAVNAKGEDADDQIVFTAAFSKVDADLKKVVTTFVAFNPTWKICYVHFFRIRSDGTLSDVPIPLQSDENGWAVPVRVDPKKMTVLQYPAPELFIVNLTGATIEVSVNPASGKPVPVKIGPQSFMPVNSSGVGPLPWTVQSPAASQRVDSLPAILYGTMTSVLYPPQPELFITNVDYPNTIVGTVKPASGEPISRSIGPKTFVQVNGPQVGPLPWTVEAQDVNSHSFPVNSLPAICNCGKSVSGVSYPSTN